MKRKTVSGLVLTVLVVGMLTFAFNIKLLRASGTIYIRADGSIEPSDGRIVTEDGVHYNFTQDIYTSIVVERDNIVVDGLGWTLEGEGSGTGINLTDVRGVTIRNMTIKTFAFNMFLSGSSHCSIFQTNVKIALSWGIFCDFSNNNTITGNTVVNNDGGILLWDSSNNNTITGNTVANNSMTGVFLAKSSNNNTITGNKLTDNNYHGSVLSVSSDNTISGNTITDNTMCGIWMNWSDCNTISGNTITHNDAGFVLSGASDNTISGNTIAHNNYGINADESSSNMISTNTITNNSHHGILLNVFSNNNTITTNRVTGNKDEGIILRNSSNSNTITENNIAYNGVGILTSGDASDSHIYHNNFVNNEVQCEQNGLNFWDDGSEGNYWSDYEGIDLNGDGIGDTDIPHHEDNCPFIGPLSPIPVFHRETIYYCSVDNSITVSRFSMDKNKTLSLNIIGEGYVNLTIPRKLLDGSFQIFVDNTPTPCLLSWDRDEPTHTFIYFEHATSVPTGVKIEAISKLQGDLNGDGIVNIRDIFIVAKNFGQTLED